MSGPGILSSWSIRSRLLLLLLIIFLPTSGIIIASGLERRAHEIEDAENSASLLVESLAAQQEQIAGGTELMLSTLAQLPEVQRLNASVCNELFRELRNRHPFYSTIGVATPDGNLVARSNPFEPGAINLSDQKHVRDAVESLGFSVGEYVVGKVSKTPTIHYSYPVLDAWNNLTAVVIAGFKLDEYARLAEKASLPEGSIVSIADHRGVRLYRLPENEATPLGEPIPATAFDQIAGKAQEGAYENTGGDGVYRVYAFKQLRLREDMPPYMYMIVGIPKEPILQQANRDLLRNLSVLGIMAFSAVGLAWLFGSRSLTEPINRLVRATGQLAEGEMGVRTGLSHTSDELGRLAKSFDEMASMLEIRSIERDKSEEALVETTKRLQLAVTSGKLGVWDWDVRSDALTWDERLFELYGISRESFANCSESWKKSLHPEDRVKAVEATLAAIYGEKEYDLEYRIVRPDGAVRVLKADAVVIRDAEGKAVRMIGLNRDITEQKIAEESMRLLPSRLLAAQEEERKRLAHELHDSIGGSLGAIKMGLENTLKLVEDGRSTPECIRDLIEMTDRTIEDARRIYANLRPAMLDDLGLIPTLGWFCRQFEAIHNGIRIEQHIEVEEEAVPEDLKIVIFRVMQESFHNIAKYSQAERVSFSLCRRGGSLELVISDNGVGFSYSFAISRRSGKGGLGLTSMRERVQLSDGAFAIESAVGEGTTVRASWDLNKRAAW